MAESESLSFEPTTHTYCVEGRKVPSVTQVLEPYTGLDYVDRRALEDARIRGTLVHAAIHRLNVLGQLEAAELAQAPYINAWLDFVSETGATVLLSERRVYSEKYGYAGTLDSVLLRDSREGLYDVKTGVVPKTVGPQTAAYLQALREQDGIRWRSRYCVQLREDGTYRLHKLTDRRDWNIFLSALNIYRWRNNL